MGRISQDEHGLVAVEISRRHGHTGGRILLDERPVRHARPRRSRARHDCHAATVLPVNVDRCQASHGRDQGRHQVETRTRVTRNPQGLALSLLGRRRVWTVVRIERRLFEDIDRRKTTRHVVLICILIVIIIDTEH